MVKRFNGIFLWSFIFKYEGGDQLPQEVVVCSDVNQACRGKGVWERVKQQKDRSTPSVKSLRSHAAGRNPLTNHPVRHRPSHVVEVGPARVDTLAPYGQVVLYIPALCLLRDSSPVWVLYRVTVGVVSGHHLDWRHSDVDKTRLPTWKRSSRSPQSYTLTQSYTDYIGTRQYICNWHTPIFVTDTHKYIDSGTWTLWMLIWTTNFRLKKRFVVN